MKKIFIVALVIILIGWLMTRNRFTRGVEAPDVTPMFFGPTRASI